MVALPMEHADGLPRDAAAAPRSAPPAGKRWRERGIGRPANHTGGEVFAEPDAILLQLDTARRRVALWTALLIVFGTLSGGLLGAHLPKPTGGAAVVAAAQNCGFWVEFDPFIP
ncbi:hypothetical protein [Piscinibacter sakaiensis]|uniref:hypothetical protein n=1 Tax=Piscinibacter sakaiensis TaxID=1547922 RepID=UPI003AAA498E